MARNPDILILLTRVGLGGEATWNSGEERIDWIAVIKLAAAQGNQEHTFRVDECVWT